jgi:hypothetical protein
LREILIPCPWEFLKPGRPIEGFQEFPGNGLIIAKSANGVCRFKEIGPGTGRSLAAL